MILSDFLKWSISIIGILTYLFILIITFLSIFNKLKIRHKTLEYSLYSIVIIGLATTFNDSYKLLTQLIFSEMKLSNMELYIPNGNVWYSFDKSGEKETPEAVLKYKDDTLIVPIKRKYFQDSVILDIFKDGNKYKISGAKDLNIGVLEVDSIKSAGLYNRVYNDDGRITAHNYVNRISWSRKNGSNWISDKSSNIGPFYPIVYGSTYYRIVDRDTDSVVFDSKIDKTLINKGKRNIHFLKKNDSYYFIRIINADLQKDSNYVTFINTKIKMILD